MDNGVYEGRDWWREKFYNHHELKRNRVHERVLIFSNPPLPIENPHSIKLAFRCYLKVRPDNLANICGDVVQITKCIYD